jgi:tetratricopeptide (TPR) repeat protein
VRHRYLFNGYANLGRCQFFLGRIDEAVESFRRARTLAPGLWYVHLELAAALSLSGDIEEAQSEIAEVLKIKREVNSIARWRAIAVTQGFGHPRFQALREKTSYTGLRRAGLPDEKVSPSQEGSQRIKCSLAFVPARRMAVPTHFRHLVPVNGRFGASAVAVATAPSGTMT